MAKWEIRATPYSIVVDGTNEEFVEAIVSDGQKTDRQRHPWPLPGGEDAAFGGVYFAVILSRNLLPQEMKDHLWQAFSHTLDCVPYAFAPIRTTPRRTYDRRTDAPRPEGQHVPMVLATLKTSNPRKWEELRAELAAFGHESGLFSTVDVRALGEESDPFQVQIIINGSPANLTDVGYGVSQVLPLLVDCLEWTNQLLLIQQPEVHLHPRAQAQIGSFFGYLVRKHGKRFIVETHSDYLVDRVRMDVRDGRHGLRPEDVSILYFERKDAAVSVHAMRIDECGNLLDAPPGYRQFFLEEEKKFIGG